MCKGKLSPISYVSGVVVVVTVGGYPNIEWTLRVSS